MKIQFYFILLMLSGFFVNQLNAQICNTNDYIALRALYMNTNGSTDWENAADWQAFDWSNPTTPPSPCALCDLQGITCDINNRVTMVHLSNTNFTGPGDPLSGLTGILPTQVGLLTELTKFNVGNNTNIALAVPGLSPNIISGSIPTEFSSCTKLTSLSLNGNDFSGSIPAGIYTLSDLEILNLSANDLTGGLSSSIGNLTKLGNLGVGYNPNFGGGIPNSIGALTELRVLNMEFCGLTGTISPAIGSCEDMVQFIIRNNINFTSMIPSQMSSLPDLEVFWGNNCDLNGPIPTFSGCPKMKRIHLSTNNFAGLSLPTSWADLTTLTYIGVARCGLTGTIPVDYGNLINLDNFHISTNQISGTLPPSMSACTQMKLFNVFDNPLLTGPLHDTYDAWTQLVRFRAHGCNFTGSVPTTYSNWANCHYFEIGGNNMSGAVPDIFNSMTNLFRVRLDSNNFTGSMPLSLASPDSLKELFIQECGLSGCFDPALDYLCNTLESYNIDAGNNFDATWNNFCASGAGECISINPTTCTFHNGLPVNHDVEGNACIHGMINISEAIHLTPMVNVPSSPEAGTMYFDAATAKLRIWDGGQWRECW